MRIAAGVLLIISALLNGCAGLAVGALGGAAVVATEGAEEFGAELQAELAKEAGNEELSEEDRKAAEDAAALLDGIDTADDVQAAGGLLMLFGIFLFVMMGLEIAAAVLLFIQKGATFIMVVGALLFVLIAIGIVADPDNINFVNIGVNGVIGAMTIMAARGIKASQQAAAEG